MKKLSYDAYEIIKDFLHYHYYNTYNANFNTMMMWDKVYDIYYYNNDHFLILLYCYEGMKFFLMPFCDSQYYKEALDYMLTLSQNMDFDFRIMFATKEFIDEINHYNNYNFLYHRTVYNDDYIYDVTSHMTLQGKKMQKRRNHYNAFIKQYPHYQFKILDRHLDRKDMIECIIKWNEQSFHGSLNELKGIKHLLDYGIDIFCCGIYIDGILEAVSISSLLNDKTVQIHVEKANRTIRGIYVALLKFMLEHQYKDILYINREDDIGVEGLIVAKTQLHPIKKLKKYMIVEKNLSIKKAKDKDLKDIINLWKESFDDEDDVTTSFYFDNIFKLDHTYCLYNNGHFIGMIQYNPMVMDDHNIAYFIVGVAILKQYQRQGCMDYLLKTTMKKYQSYRLYLQAYNEDVYKKYGFKPSHLFKEYFISNNSYNKDLCVKDIDVNHMLCLYKQYIKRFTHNKLRNINDFNIIVKRCKSYNDHIIMIDEGYMIYSIHHDYNYIKEIVYLNNQALFDMIGLLNEKDVYVLTDYQLNLNHPYKIKTAMMSNTHNDNIDNHYINELF